MREFVKTFEAIDYDKILTFLKRVSTLDIIDEDVMKRCVFVQRGEEVVGMVSYEVFEKTGMIRYFVYDQTVTPELIINLFFRLYYEAKEAGVAQLVAIAATEYACHLFEMLGFMKTNNACSADLFDVNQADVSVLSIDLVSGVVYDEQ